MHFIDFSPAHADPITEYGSDGVRRTVRAGEGAVIARGEVHTKGSEGGCSAVMVQLAQLMVADETRV